MNKTNKQALWEAAERAGQNDWEYVYTSDLSAPGRGYITVGGAEAIYCLNKAAGGAKQSENVLRYIAAARPEKMLALLDEMDAKDRRIAELERKEQHSDRQSVIDALASSGEEWSDIEEYMQKWDAERASAAGKGEAS